MRAAVERVITDGPWILGPEVESFEAAFAGYTGLAAHRGGRQRHRRPGRRHDRARPVAGRRRARGRRRGRVRRHGRPPRRARARGRWTSPRRRRSSTPAPPPRPTAPGSRPSSSPTCTATPYPSTELDAWRRAHGLALVEDCAQAHGLRVGGRHVGTTGDAATFSFYPTKNLGAVGDGGLVGFTDPTVAERARALRQYGWVDERFRPRPRRRPQHPARPAPGSRARRPACPTSTPATSAVATWPTAGGAPSRARPSCGATPRPPSRTTPSRSPTTATTSPTTWRRAASTRPCTTPTSSARCPASAPREPPRRWPPRWRARILSLPCFPELTDEEADHVAAALHEWTPRG